MPLLIDCLLQSGVFGCQKQKQLMDPSENLALMTSIVRPSLLQLAEVLELADYLLMFPPSLAPSLRLHNGDTTSSSCSTLSDEDSTPHVSRSNSYGRAENDATAAAVKAPDGSYDIYLR